LASRKAAKSRFPSLGKFSQAFGRLNGMFAERQHENGENPPFFEFGTPPALYPASPGEARITSSRRPHMFAIKTSNRLFAAAFSVAFSAVFFAYAIIPASPTLAA
jgi:hypothetical protein